MKIPVVLLLAGLLLAGSACTNLVPTAQVPSQGAIKVSSTMVKLPEPRVKSNISLEETLSQRRSVRESSGIPLTLQDVSQLLWAAQGTTSPSGGRTAPSAGGLYPLEVYLVSGNVENLNAGVYKYKPQTHELVIVKDKDVRQELAEAALGQSPVKDSAIDIVIAAVYERTTGKYGDRGIRYVHMEAGHAAQNVCLQATALNLGTVTIGAFYDDKVKAVLAMPQEEVPLYIMPVGKK